MLLPPKELYASLKPDHHQSKSPVPTLCVASPRNLDYCTVPQSRPKTIPGCGHCKPLKRSRIHRVPVTCQRSSELKLCAPRTPTACRRPISVLSPLLCNCRSPDPASTATISLPLPGSSTSSRLSTLALMRQRLKLAGELVGTCLISVRHGHLLCFIAMIAAMI